MYRSKFVWTKGPIRGSSQNYPWRFTGSLTLKHHIDGLAQDCSNSIANAPELLQSCIKPSMYAIAPVSAMQPWST